MPQNKEPVPQFPRPDQLRLIATQIQYYSRTNSGWRDIMPENAKPAKDNGYELRILYIFEGKYE